MKKILIAGIICFTFQFSAQSQSLAQTPAPKTFGLGLALGSPTAITGQYWLGNDTNIDFGLSFWSSNYFLVYGDYHWVFHGYFGHKSQFVSQLAPYVGVGGGLFSWASGYYYRNRPNGWQYYDGSVGLYGRLPFGVEWFTRRPNLGVFAEIVPGITLIPGLGMIIDIAIGARYYF